MTAIATAHGELIEPRTVRIERMLPGPIERVWDYLTDSDLRAQWLAAGRMEQQPGARVEFVWRNDDLSDGAPRPEGMAAEHRMEVVVVRAERPRLLVLNWGASGSEVIFELQEKGDEVKFTLTHRKMPDRDMLLGVSAGWHAHVDLLIARLGGGQALPFWENWQRLRTEYDARIPT